MRIVSIVTDYLRKSLLTTKGDMIVRGVGEPERLPLGNDYDVVMTFGGERINGIPRRLQDVGSVPYGTKIVSIGDWNMDLDTTKIVLHGTILNNIIGVRAIIRDDGNVEKYRDASISMPTQETHDFYIGRIGTSGVELWRRAGGYFDSTNFDATGYNRGWLVITILV